MKEFFSQKIPTSEALIYMVFGTLGVITYGLWHYEWNDGELDHIVFFTIVGGFIAIGFCTRTAIQWLRNDYEEEEEEEDNLT